MAKKFPHTAQVERRGIALCQTVVAEMNHIWREKAVSDVGIDGEIELVDPASDEALGRLLLVQSKARSGPFDRETNMSFTFRCSSDDLKYWLSSTAPVILVCSHPDQKQAWFKNLPAWFSTEARLRSRTVEFDKTTDRFDVSASQRLLDWGVPASTGIYLQPAPRPETLTTNLLRVEHMADSIHVAPSRVRGWRDVNALLRKAGHDPVDDVVWREKQLFSFRRLDQPPLDALVDDTPESLATDELADSKADDNRLLVRLLNNTLHEINRGRLIWHRERGYFYFPASPTLESYKVSSGRSSGGRTVFAKYTDKATGERAISYRHYALRCQFLHLEDGWFLALEPTYHFTIDGYKESRFAGESLKKIKGFERNEAVGSLIKFWAEFLRSKNDLFSTPDQRIRFGLLAQVDVGHGIDDSFWKPRYDDPVATDEEAIDLTESPKSEQFSLLEGMA